MVGQLAGVITTIIVARSLGPNGRGLITTLTVWGQFMGWCAAFSLDKAVIVLSSPPNPTFRPDEALRISRAAVLGMSLPGAAISWVVGGIFFVDHRLAILLVIIAIATSQAELVSGWLLATGKRAQYIAWRLSQPLLYLLTALGLAAAFNSAAISERTLPFGIGAAAAILVPVVVSAVLLPSKPFVRKGPVAKMLKFGLPAQTASLLQYLNTRLDILALPFLVSAATVGQYAVGAALGQATMLLGTAGVIRAITGDSERDAVGWTLVCVASGLIILTAPWLIPFLFGPEFAESIRIAQVLAFAGPFNYGLQVAAGRLLAQNRAWDTALAQFVGVGTFLVGLGLVSTSEGVAWASVLSYAIAFSVAQVIVRVRRDSNAQKHHQ